MFSSSGGVLFAERILRDLARHLTARGVALHIHEQVVRVDSARAAIVTADGREDRGDALIVAEGFWAPQLLPALAGRVTPSRQVPVYLAPPQDRLAAWRAAPMLLDQIEATQGGFYAVPPVDGTALKVGERIAAALAGECRAEGPQRLGRRAPLRTAAGGAVVRLPALL